MAFFRSFVAIAVVLSVATASVIKEEGNKHHGYEYHGDHNPNFREHAESTESVESTEEKNHSGPYYHGVHNPNFPASSAEDLEVKETEYQNEFNSKEINDHGPSYHGTHNPNFNLNSGEAGKPSLPHHGPGSESHESHSHESHSHEHGHHGFDHKYPFLENLPFFKPHHDHNSQESGSHEHGHGPHNPNFPMNSGEADKPWPPHGHESESHENHSHENGHHGFEHKFPFFEIPFLKPHHGPQGQDSGSNEQGPNHEAGNHFPFMPFNQPNQDGSNEGEFNFPNFKPEDDKVVDGAGFPNPNSEEHGFPFFPIIPNFDQQGPRDEE